MKKEKKMTSSFLLLLSIDDIKILYKGVAVERDRSLSTAAEHQKARREAMHTNAIIKP